MFSGLVMLLVLGGTPVKLPEVIDGEGVKAQMGNEVALVGQLERVSMQKGPKSWAGTALVLDDDTTVWVTYGAPPAGWEPLVGARVRVEGVLRPSLSEHEQSLLAPHVRNPKKLARAPRALKTLLGKRVRLSGTAQNAKGGAVVVIDGAPIYLAGLEGWPTGVSGQPVAVGGTLVDKQYLPEATKNAKGEVSQGAVGSQLVLEAPTWSSLSPAGERAGERVNPP